MLSQPWNDDGWKPCGMLVALLVGENHMEYPLSSSTQDMMPYGTDIYARVKSLVVKHLVCDMGQ